MSQEQREAVEAVVTRYVEAARNGDVDTLRDVFHPQAAMFGTSRAPRRQPAAARITPPTSAN